MSFVADKLIELASGIGVEILITKSFPELPGMFVLSECYSYSQLTKMIVCGPDGYPFSEPIPMTMITWGVRTCNYKHYDDVNRSIIGAARKHKWNYFEDCGMYVRGF